MRLVKNLLFKFIISIDKMTVAQIVGHEIGICPVTLKNIHTLTSSKVCYH